MNETFPTGDAPLLAEFETADLEQWRREVERLLKGAPFAKKMFTRTLEGITVSPMYTAADTTDLPWSEQWPGQAPFVRGGGVTGGRRWPWLISQELPLPTVEEFNNALRHDLKTGQTAVRFTLDRAGRWGLDPDQAPPRWVGGRGTSAINLGEFETAFDGVDLETTPLDIQAGAAALPAAAVVAALVRKRGATPATLSGCFGADPVDELARHGSLPLSMGRVHDQLAVLTLWAREHAPGLLTLPVHEDPWHDGGADGALTLGLTLATAVSALRAMEQRGVALEDAAPRVRFHLCVGGDFFMEIAKFRALRLLWTDVQVAAGIEPTPAAIHARTSRRTQTVLDPHVNMLRATTQAMAAIFGGVDSLHVAPFDEVDGLPDEFSRRIARNVHLLLAHEGRFDQVADPAGGSWYVEKLTEELAAAAWARFQETEKEGGVLEGLRGGRIQERVAAVAEERRRRLATRRDVIVGTNRYADPLEKERAPREVDHAALQGRRGVQAVGARTAGADHAGVVAQLGRTLDGVPAELFAHLEGAAVQGASLGELMGVLRQDDRPDPEITPIPLRRDAAPFEDVRARIEAGRGRRPRAGRVHCACLGEQVRYVPRLDFVRGFFQVGGCEVLAEESHSDVTAAARAAAAADAATCVIVGLDAAYAEQAADLAIALKALDPPPRVMLAGAPGDDADALIAAGVDEFIHTRSDVLAVLGRLAESMEVTP